MALFDDLIEAQKLFFETSERIGKEAVTSFQQTLEALAKAAEGGVQNGADKARIAELERQLAALTAELRRRQAQPPPEVRVRPPQARPARPQPAPAPAPEKKPDEEKPKSDRFELIEMD